MVDAFTDAGVAVRGVALLAVIGTLISSAQLLASWRMFAPGGLLDWKVARERRKVRRTPLRLLSGLEHDHGVVAVILVVRGAASLAVALSVTRGDDPIGALALVVLTNAWLAMRGAGHATSGKLDHLLPLALLIALIDGSRAALTAVLVFIAAVACVAYTSAGLAKVRSRDWGAGAFLSALMATRFWGGSPLSSWVRQTPGAARVLERGFVTFELLFPLVLVLPPRVAAVVLAIGALFHALLAATLGLNLFFWMFVATYPAILFTAGRIASLLR